MSYAAASAVCCLLNRFLAGGCATCATYPDQLRRQSAESTCQKVVFRQTQSVFQFLRFLQGAVDAFMAHMVRGLLNQCSFFEASQHRGLSVRAGDVFGAALSTYSGSDGLVQS